jgi:hypothetical protein
MRTAASALPWGAALSIALAAARGAAGQEAPAPLEGPLVFLGDSGTAGDLDGGVGLVTWNEALGVTPAEADTLDFNWSSQVARQIQRLAEDLGFPAPVYVTPNFTGMVGAEDNRQAHLGTMLHDEIPQAFATGKIHPSRAEQALGTSFYAFHGEPGPVCRRDPNTQATNVGLGGETLDGLFHDLYCPETVSDPCFPDSASADEITLRYGFPPLPPGACTTQVDLAVAILAAAREEGKAGTVVIEIGVNATAPGGFEQDYRRLFEALRAANPSVNLVAWTVPNLDTLSAYMSLEEAIDLFGLDPAFARDIVGLRPGELVDPFALHDRLVAYFSGQPLPPTRPVATVGGLQKDAGAIQADGDAIAALVREFDTPAAGAALVDAGAVLAAMVRDGVPVEVGGRAITLRFKYGQGLQGFDATHGTPTLYRVLANAVIAAMNARWFADPAGPRIPLYTQQEIDDVAAQDGYVAAYLKTLP